MARAAWQGYITLGQLGVPVRLYSATQAVRPRFVQLHEKDSSLVERVLQCREEHREIPSSEVIRAVEHAPGRYIALTDRELEQTAARQMKAIDVKQFCDVTSIPPMYFEKPYYVSPSRGGERAYALIREVFARTGKIAVAQFAIYNQEHIAALMVEGDLLILNQLRFAAEIVPRDQVKTPPLPKPSPSEVNTLTNVAKRFSGPFYAHDYHDEYAEHLNRLIERKAKGLPAPRAERPVPRATPEKEIESTLRDALGAQQIAAGVDEDGLD